MAQLDAVEEEDGFLEKLDGPRLVIAALVVFILLMLLVVTKLWIDVNNVVEARELEARRANEQTVDRCFASATQSVPLQRVLIALRDSVDDPVAKYDIQNYLNISKQQTSTIRECRILAQQLNIPVPKEFQ